VFALLYPDLLPAGDAPPPQVREIIHLKGLSHENYGEGIVIYQSIALCNSYGRLA